MDPKEEEIPYAFAQLKPNNTDACKAFSKVVDAMINNPKQFEHHRKFIRYSPTQVLLHSVLNLPSTSSSVGTGTDTETEPTVGEDAKSENREQMIWQGSFHLSLDVAPFFPALGWRAGSGRWNKNPIASVDLLLSYLTPQDSVRGNHVIFGFNKNTGVLMLQPCHGGQHGIKLDAKSFAGPSNAQALLRPASVIQIGRLEYQLEFTMPVNHIMEKLFQKEKAKYFQERLHAPPPIEATSGTPSWNNMVIGPWTAISTVGRGSYGVVSAAIHWDGSVIAVKSFLRHNRQSDKSVMDEVATAKRLMIDIKRHDYREFVLHLQEVIFERRAPMYDLGPPEQVWMLYTPLARCTFSPDLIPQEGRAPARETRIALLEQVLKGLVCLHAQNWVHRDLKPTNLGVVSIDPPKAVILDLGTVYHVEGDEVVSGIRPQPGHIGTVMYLAPEMEFERYNERVDIWAFGLVVHEVMIGFHPWKMSVNPWHPQQNKRYANTMTYYSSHLGEWKQVASDTVENLLSRLLAWNPRERLSAAEALQHPFFNSGRACATFSAEIQTGQKREREGE